MCRWMIKMRMEASVSSGLLYFRTKTTVIFLFECDNFWKPSLDRMGSLLGYKPHFHNTHFSLKCTFKKTLKKFLCVCVCIPAWVYMHHMLQVPVKARRGWQIPWNWRYRLLGTDWCECCKPNLGLLKAQSVLLSTQPSLQPYQVYFILTGFLIPEGLKWHLYIIVIFFILTELTFYMSFMDIGKRRWL